MHNTQNGMSRVRREIFMIAWDLGLRRERVVWSDQEEKKSIWFCFVHALECCFSSSAKLPRNIRSELILRYFFIIHNSSAYTPSINDSECRQQLAEPREDWLLWWCNSRAVRFIAAEFLHSFWSCVASASCFTLGVESMDRIINLKFMLVVIRRVLL